MSHVRIMVIEAEIAEAAVLQDLIEGLEGLCGKSIIQAPVANAPAAAPPVAAPTITPRWRDASGKIVETRPAVTFAEACRAKKKAAGGGASRKAAPVSAAPAEDGSTRQVIIDALKKRPMTSGDVITATGLSKSQVYSMLNVLRGEGIVESRKDEGDIYPKQYLVKA